MFNLIFKEPMSASQSRDFDFNPHLYYWVFHVEYPPNYLTPCDGTSSIGVDSAVNEYLGSNPGKVTRRLACF